MSQGALGERCSPPISHSAVSACERGLTCPSILERLAEVLGVADPRSLLDFVTVETTIREE
jgi:hypothetical protein